jgi:hypothetical protein
MKRSMDILWVAVLIVVLARLTQAQSSPGPSGFKSNPNRTKEADENPNYDLAMGRAKQFAREYSLTPEQADAAMKIYTARLIPFPNKEPFKSLIREMAQQKEDIRKAHQKGEDYPIEKIQKVYKAMEPFMEEARQVYLGNEEAFHKILNDEQKKKHAKAYDKLRGTLNFCKQERMRWIRGEVTQKELAAYAETYEEKMEKQQQNPIVQTDPASIDYWEVYVKAFIQAFELDQGQQTMAWSVFGELKPRAEGYKKDHEREYKDLHDRLERLQTQPCPKERTEQQKLAQMFRDGEKRRKELDAPVNALFEGLKQRLLAIPTKDQFQKAGELSEAQVLTAGKAKNANPKSRSEKSTATK